jgi:hypothetical protein
MATLVVQPDKSFRSIFGERHSNFPHNPVTFLGTNSLISCAVELGSPITGSPANLLNENNDEAVLSYKCSAFLL